MDIRIFFSTKHSLFFIISKQSSSSEGDGVDERLDPGPSL